MKIKDEHDFDKRLANSNERCWEMLAVWHNCAKVEELRKTRCCSIRGWNCGKRTDTESRVQSPDSTLTDCPLPQWTADGGKTETRKWMQSRADVSVDSRAEQVRLNTIVARKMRKNNKRGRTRRKKKEKQRDLSRIRIQLYDLHLGSVVS